jgi:hypothetical protein
MSGPLANERTATDTALCSALHFFGDSATPCGRRFEQYERNTTSCIMVSAGERTAALQSIKSHDEVSYITAPAPARDHLYQPAHRKPSNQQIKSSLCFLCFFLFFLDTYSQSNMHAIASFALALASSAMVSASPVSKTGRSFTLLEAVNNLLTHSRVV